MRPWLIEWPVPGLGTFAVSGYFAALLTALLAAAAVLVHGRMRQGRDGRQALLDAALLVGIGLVGARLGHMLTVSPGRYVQDPTLLLRFWEGGLVFYGGFVLAATAGLRLARRRDGSILPFADAAAPAVALGLAFGRLGCFAAGCCYGRPVDWPTGQEWPWGVVFLRGQVPNALKGIPLHPTQIYESLGAALLALVLLRWRRLEQPGAKAGFFLFAYALLRYSVEWFRFDRERGFVFEGAIGQVLSTSQAISVPIFAAGLFLLLRTHRAPTLSTSSLQRQHHASLVATAPALPHGSTT